ncbi:MAG: acetolactate decarboxylase [Anaerovibrio sp.]|uniref:acetolactate decarboxylase n=1 Tax=Anaerovibrio sp. TaxID=1872532 RepID=UPI0025EFADEB|nr:acetolactate decarboxylase [Anaerovibrio sp.]MCR5176108.1 acetolactate decarboxylase [Anaerovibrio sp.]
MKINIKKKIALAVIVGLLASSVSYASTAVVERETLNQVALLQSLAQGYLGGTVTVRDLRSLGDTGIGTFEGLNGEMIVLDGTVYQALGDGRVVVADDKVGVPYATVTYFDEDIFLDLKDVKDKKSFEALLDKEVKNCGKNSFYMVKLHTEFSSILFRSEYGSQKPYPTLVEALRGKQTEFTAKNIKGTLVGLYCPDYMGGLNSPGWHFHFISDNKQQGGHVLELSLKKGTAELDKTDKFAMVLHNDRQFHEMNLAKDMSKDINSAEHDTKSAMKHSE